MYRFVIPYMIVEENLGKSCASDLKILLKRALLVSKFYGQATKGRRWMPWHIEAMKDVASCEKLR